MNTLTLISPAKINLFLLINGQRPNGYHNLQTLFQILDYGDKMSFEVGNSTDIEILPPIEGVSKEDNLIFKAAKLLRTETQSESFGVTISIEKCLPMGGGLGGGSSNAATTLLALNKLWDLGLSIDELAKIGLTLGADVPVFVRGKSAFAEGIGEELTPIDLPSDCFVILKPKCHVSTVEIFSDQRLTRDTPKIKIAPALGGGQTNLDASDSIRSALYQNDCTAVACELYPEIDELLNYLKQFGSAAMTGTGSCCFVRIDKDELANNAKLAEEILENAPDKFSGFIANGVNISPTIKGLDEATQLATS